MKFIEKNGMILSQDSKNILLNFLTIWKNQQLWKIIIMKNKMIKITNKFKHKFQNVIRNKWKGTHKDLMKIFFKIHKNLINIMRKFNTIKKLSVKMK